MLITRLMRVPLPQSLRGGEGGVFQTHSTIGVVVALEYEIDFVFEDDREPEVAEGFVIAAFGGAVHRVVECEDCPVGLGFGKNFVEPGGLLFRFFE